MINNVILVGRLISEPEIVSTKENIPTKWTKFILTIWIWNWLYNN